MSSTAQSPRPLRAATRKAPGPRCAIISSRRRSSSRLSPRTGRTSFLHDDPVGLKSMSNPRALRLNAEDNVLIAVDEIRVGDQPRGGPIALARVPKGHKMASVAIAAGAPILKFGQVIGFASEPIVAGQWVHEHNVEMHDFARDYRFCEAARPEPLLPATERATFEGYRRANGKAGTRNYVAILTSVNCSATVARLIAREVERSGMLEGYPNVDGVIALVHGTGCGMAAK